MREGFYSVPPPHPYIFWQHRIKHAHRTSRIVVKMLRLSQIVGRVHNIFGKKIFGRLRLTQNKQTWRRQQQQQKNKCDKNRPIILSYGIRLSCHGIFFYFITNGNVCVTSTYFCSKRKFVAPLFILPLHDFCFKFPKMAPPVFFFFKMGIHQKTCRFDFWLFPALKNLKQK